MQFPSENTPPHTPSGLTSTPTFVYLSNISVGPQPSSHNHPHTLGPLKHYHGLVISPCDMFLLLQLLALRLCRTPRSPSRCWHPGLQSLWPLVVCPLTGTQISLSHQSLHLLALTRGKLHRRMVKKGFNKKARGTVVVRHRAHPSKCTDWTCLCVAGSFHPSSSLLPPLASPQSYLSPTFQPSPKHSLISVA